MGKRAKYLSQILLNGENVGGTRDAIQVTKLITVFYAINGIAILLMLYDQIRRLRDPLTNHPRIAPEHDSQRYLED